MKSKSVKRHKLIMLFSSLIILCVIFAIAVISMTYSRVSSYFSAESYNNADSTTVRGTFSLNTSVNITAANGKGGVDLSWTNLGENIVYKAYQKKQGATEWTPISTMDFNKTMDPVKVLNVYPHLRSDIPTVTFTYLDGSSANLPKSAALKVWMEGGRMNENGKISTFPAYGKNPYTGQQLLNVTPVTASDFNNNPNMIWNYDVVMFGTWDTNGAYYDQPNQNALNVIESYIQSGYGVLCGHDTIGYDWNNWGLSKLRNYFNIEVGKWGSDYRTASGVDYQDSWGYVSTNVQVKKQGLLTNFPWELPLGSTLTIPAAHTCSNAAKGDTWMDFVNGTWFNGGGTDYRTNYYSYGKGNGFYYLTTYNNTAMIQTGHSNCNSTEDERKVLANTLFYLKQLTSQTSVTDNSSQDFTPPNAPDIKFVRRGDKYISFSGTDNGTPYSFYVEAYSKSDYKNAISVSNTSTETVATGVKGYYYVIDDNEKSNFSIENATYTEDRIPLKNEYLGKYIHARAVDTAGNVGEVADRLIENLVTLNKSAQWVDAQNAIAEISLDISIKAEEENRPLDVIIVQDVSGSMASSVSGKTRLQWSKEALTGFADKVYTAAPDSRIALISFGSSSNDVNNTYIHCGLTGLSNKNNLINAINGLNTNGAQTNFSAGLQKAIDLIKSQGNNQERETCVLFVSDGEPWPSSSNGLTEAKTLKNMGNVKIYGVGIMISGNSTAKTNIKNICGEENYLAINSASDFNTVYTTIFKNIVNYTNENIVCTDIISKYFKIVENQNHGDNVKIQNNEVSWNIGTMRSGTTSLKVKIQLRDEYRYSEQDINTKYETNEKAELNYTEHELITDYKENYQISASTPKLNYISTPEIITIKVEDNNASHGIEYFGLFENTTDAKTNIVRSINYATENSTTFSVKPRDNYYLYMVDSNGNKLNNSHFWYYQVTSVSGNIIQISNGFRIVNTSTCTITQTPNESRPANVKNDILTVKNSQNAINLKRIWLTIAGNVWNDRDKDGKNSGNSDEGMENITVILHMQTSEGDETISTKTNKNGEYKFEKVDIAYQNYVEFRYNGEYYAPTVYKANNVDWSNSSKVVEDINERRYFNEKFAVVASNTNSYTRNELFNKGVIDRFGNIISNTQNSETSYANNCIISAYTGYNQNNTFCKEYYVTEETKDNLGFDNYDFTKYINLGLIDRQEADVAIVEDIFSVTATINGKREDYKYNKKLNYKTANIYEIDERVSRGYYANNYTREIYKSDYNYVGEDSLDIYVTYQLAIKNKSNEIAVVANEIVNYYDEDLSFYDIYLGYDNGNRVNSPLSLFEVGTTSKYGSTNKISGYNTLYIRNEENKIKITAGGECYIYLTFKVNKIDDKLKIDTAKASIVELNAYSTYYYLDNAPNKNNAKTQKDYEPGEIAGIIDLDSNPGNLNRIQFTNLDKETMFNGKDVNELKSVYGIEDDSDVAPSIKFITNYQGVDFERTITGTVWEDSRNVEKDFAQIGDGILKNDELGIEGVKVELVNKNTNAVVLQTQTDENGKYLFTGFIPDEYFVRFIYGTDGGKYNGQDYKSTLYTQTVNQDDNDISTFNIESPDNEDIYNLKKANYTEIRESDARDLYGDETIKGSRQYVNNYCDNSGNGVTNKLATELKEQSSDEFKENTYMIANSASINIEIEYDRKESETSLTGSNNIGNGNYDLSSCYQLQNLDFGLIERPKSQLELIVEIANVKVILSNGQTLFDASEKATNVMWISKDKNTDYYNGNLMKVPTVRTNTNGQIVLTMDKEIMHGATVRLTYRVSAVNIGEVDYYDPKFYYIGQEDRPYTENTVNVSDTNIVTTTLNTVISYVGTQLTDEEVATRNNLQFEKEQNTEWDIITIDEIINKKLLDNRLIEEAKKYSTIIQTDSLGTKELVPILVSQENGIAESKVLLIETITPESSTDDRCYNCMAEIIRTSNTVGRRMEYSVAGNQSPVKKVEEVDADSAEELVILPPFGQNSIYYILGFAISAILLIGIIGVIMIIKRK